jgi:O-antigen/teichoic acid export membrane protein
LNLIEKLLGNNSQTFLKKFALVFSGSTFSQVITLATYPILTRVFSVEEFGIFTNFFGLMVVFSVIQSLKLQHAIVIEKNELNTFYLLIICLILPIINSVLLYLLFQFDISFFQFINETNLLFPIILSGLLMVFYDVGYNFLAKYGLFKNLVFIKIMQNSSIVIFQLLYGFSLNDNNEIPFNNGLIAGFIFGQVFSLLLLMFILIKYSLSKIKSKLQFNLMNYVQIIFNHKKFIYYSMPAEFINSLSYYLVIYFITINFGVFYAGLYGLSQRVIMGPLNLISLSLLDIFKNYASEELIQSNSINKSYKLMLKILFILSIFCFIVILILKDYFGLIFGLIFGEEWKDVGKIVLILTPFYLTKFISNPLSYTFFLVKKQEIDLFWQAGLLLIVYFVFFASDNFYNALTIFSVMVSTYYLFNLFLSYKLSVK